VKNDNFNRNAVATALMDDFVSTIDGDAYLSTSPGVNAPTMSASVLVGGSVNGVDSFHPLPLMMFPNFPLPSNSCYHIIFHFHYCQRCSCCHA